MTSILTNPGAMVALQSLTSTQKALSDTNNKISTGLKIQTAKDGAAAWTIATTMKANISSLGQIATGLGNADSVLGTAVSGANQVASYISQIRDKVASLKDPSTWTSVQATQNEVDQLVNQIGATIQSSSFNGINLLDGSTATGANKSSLANGHSGVSFLAATANDYNGTTTGLSSTIDADTKDSDLTLLGGDGSGTKSAMQNLYDMVDSAGLGLTNVYTKEGADPTSDSEYTLTAAASGTTPAGSLTAETATNAGTTGDTAVTQVKPGLAGLVEAIQNNPNKLDAFLSVIDQAATKVKNASAQFGAVQQNVQAQNTFVSTLSDTLTQGVSNLVDADMTKESARLSALQTQQQLGTQALSIANQAPQMILKLFNG